MDRLHSNEITAIPALLDLLKIKGAIVTIDAAGCQTDIAGHIREKKADYVLAVKGNQGSLLEDARFAFEEVEQEDIDERWVDYEKTVDKGHGRIEIREYFYTEETSWSKRLKDFPGARSFGMVKSTRIIGEKRTTEIRYYISSLAMNAKCQTVRSRRSDPLECREQPALDTGHDLSGGRFPHANWVFSRELRDDASHCIEPG